MRDTPKLAWEALEKYYFDHKEEFENVNFAINEKERYIKDFENMYNLVRTKYMYQSVEELDRHKQAAILLYCTIKNKVFRTQKKIGENKIFVGCEQIGLLLSLSYMKDRLNSILLEIKEKPIDKYEFPIAFSCETEYFDILTRDLYLQEHNDDGVYILSLAHILYLIEYYTLYKIDMRLIEKIKHHTSSSPSNKKPSE